MRSQSLLPHPLLRPYIRQYLLIESDEEVENNLLPATSLVMSIRYKGKTFLKSNEQRIQLHSMLVSGIQHTARKVIYSAGTANFLVIFKPGGAAFFFQDPLHLLYCNSTEVNALSVGKNFDLLPQMLADANNHVKRAGIVDTILWSSFRNKKKDLILEQAVECIEASGGQLKIAELLTQLPISRDVFEKRFRRSMGTSPKQFSEIIRMRSIVAHPPKTKSLTQLAYNAGFFDQSHFIKEFKTFSGKTPSEFLRSDRFW